jgi:hypothetical protein
VEQAEEAQVEIVALNTLNCCYDGHMNGDSGCGCGCACILIGKLELSFKENPPNFVTDYSHVRQIRPWLIGQELNRRKT